MYRRNRGRGDVSRQSLASRPKALLGLVSAAGRRLFSGGPLPPPSSSPSFFPSRALSASRRSRSVRRNSSMAPWSSPTSRAPAAVSEARERRFCRVQTFIFIFDLQEIFASSIATTVYLKSIDFPKVKKSKVYVIGENGILKNWSLLDFSIFVVCERGQKH